MPVEVSSRSVAAQGIVGNLMGNGLIEPCDRRLACRRNRQLLGAVHNGAVGRFALRRCSEKCRRFGRVAWRGGEAGVVAEVSAGVETGDCAGVGADAGLGASAGLRLDGRAPPPMSSSAVHGRSFITSSRLSENRSSSPSSNMRAHVHQLPESIRDRCMMPCSTPFCSILPKY